MREFSVILNLVRNDSEIICFSTDGAVKKKEKKVELKSEDTIIILKP